MGPWRPARAEPLPWTMQCGWGGRGGVSAAVERWRRSCGGGRADVPAAADVPAWLRPHQTRRPGDRGGRRNMHFGNTRRASRPNPDPVQSTRDCPPPPPPPERWCRTKHHSSDRRGSVTARVSHQPHGLTRGRGCRESRLNEALAAGFARHHEPRSSSLRLQPLHLTAGGCAACESAAPPLRVRRAGGGGSAQDARRCADAWHAHAHAVQVPP